MTIQATGLSAISIGDLLEQNLRIPQYQRPLQLATRHRFAIAG